MDRIKITIRFQKKTHKELQKQAALQGISINDLVNILTRRGLDDLDPKTFRGGVNKLLGINIQEIRKKYREDNNDAANTE